MDDLMGHFFAQPTHSKATLGSSMQTELELQQEFLDPMSHLDLAKVLNP